MLGQAWEAGLPVGSLLSALRQTWAHYRADRTWSRRLDQRPPVVCSSPNYSMILWNASFWLIAVSCFPCLAAKNCQSQYSLFSVLPENNLSVFWSHNCSSNPLAFSSPNSPRKPSAKCHYVWWALWMDWIYTVQNWAFLSERFWPIYTHRWVRFSQQTKIGAVSGSVGNKLATTTMICWHSCLTAAGRPK